MTQKIPLADAPEEPKELDAKDPDIDMEARRDQAEDLKLKALQDGVKDIDREAKIERLEGAGDMVADVSKDPAGKGTFAQGDWHSDRGKPKPAKTEKAWYKLSDRRQQIELEKLSGTYRYCPGDHYAKTRAKGGGEYRVFTQGSLHDSHESAKVRRNNTVANGIINADLAKTKTKTKPLLPAPERIFGYCRECHTAIPRNMRTDAKFCSEAHSKAFRRRELAKEVANRALFKDYQPGACIPGLEHPYFYPPPAPEPLPLMTASYAAQSNQVGKYLMVRKNALCPG